MDRQVYVPLVDLPDRHAAVARHGPVHGVLPKDGAVGAVEGVGRHRADHVGRVDVLDGQRLLLLEQFQTTLTSNPEQLHKHSYRNKHNYVFEGALRTLSSSGAGGLVTVRSCLRRAGTGSCTANPRTILYSTICYILYTIYYIPCTIYYSNLC